MTFPEPGTNEGDEPRRIPTQAELDAEDLAALAHSSRDSDLTFRYPTRPADPGPPPRALVRDARIVWLIAAAFGLICVAYGFWRLGSITDALAARLEPGLTEMAQKNIAQNDSAQDPVDRAKSLASFWAPAVLVILPLLVVPGYPLLIAIASRCSRNLRSIFLALVVLDALFIVVGADLLFRNSAAPTTILVFAWATAALLVLCALLTLRRSVTQWLPESAMTLRTLRAARN